MREADCMKRYLIYRETYLYTHCLKMVKKRFAIVARGLITCSTFAIWYLLPGATKKCHLLQNRKKLDS